MSSRTKRIYQQLPAYLFLGIIIALFVGLFIVFAYVLLWGILLGSLFWLCAFIKQSFSTKKKNGRIIDHD